MIRLLLKKKPSKINFDNLLKQKPNENENNKGLGKGVGEPEVKGKVGLSHTQFFLVFPFYSIHLCYIAMDTLSRIRFHSTSYTFQFPKTPSLSPFPTAFSSTTPFLSSLKASRTAATTTTSTTG
jgi:hypothetical protein